MNVTEIMELIVSVQVRMFENISVCFQECQESWVDKIRESLILLFLR